MKCAATKWRCALSISVGRVQGEGSQGRGLLSFPALVLGAEGLVKEAEHFLMQGDEGRAVIVSA